MNGGNMKKEVDYEAAKEYDWTLFTEEDRKEYKEILLSMPYDAGLAEFFHKQRRLEIRENNLRRRYISEKATAAFNRGKLEMQSPDTGEEECSMFERAILLGEIENLDSVPRRRLVAHFFKNKTYKTISQEEGVSAAAVCECVRLALKKIRKRVKGI